MKFHRFILITFLIFNSVLNLLSQKNVQISGFLYDSLSLEPIFPASILVSNANLIAATNESGFYSITIDCKENQSLEFRSPDYQTKILKLDQCSDTFVNLYLSTNSKWIQEIVVKSPPKSELGILNMPIKELKRIPMLGGEADVIKAFQLMPGVSGGKEGTSGLYVRGGSPDQNLFLLDNSPLYYVSHIGGLVSTFDPNMIGSISLYKGNFPAKYGGRLSAIVDIRMKDGNHKKRMGEVSVGIISTKFQFEGPISKKDSSITFLISARRMNLDIFMRPIALLMSNGQSTTGYTFYDVSAKIVKRFKDNSKLTLSIYDGRDRIFINSRDKRQDQNSNVSIFKSNVNWGNRLMALNYMKVFSNKVFGNFHLSTTNFRYISDFKLKYSDIGSTEMIHQNDFTFQSKVNDIIYKSDFQFSLSQQFKIVAGYNSIFHQFIPGRIFSSENEEKESLNNTKILAWENNLFGDLKFNFLNRISGNIGINGTSFTLRDTSYFSFDPRFSIGIEISPSVNFKAGFTQMNQYLHYLSYSGAGLPSDLWIPVTKNLHPSKALQYNAGFTFLNNKVVPFVLTIEGFYKQMNQLIEYKEGVGLFSQNAIEDKIETNGIGNVYGFEVMIHKSIGKTTGWIAYTWSKNERQFDGINDGIKFPYKYDRRHDLNVVFSQSIPNKKDKSKNVLLTATWVLSSGNAITLAKGTYQQMDLGTYLGQNYVQPNYFNTAEEYGGRNSFRMPMYHRLDVGVSFMKQKPKGVRTWNFSIYNVYNKQNVYLLFYKENANKEMSLHQLTLFPLIPSFSYSFAF